MGNARKRWKRQGRGEKSKDRGGKDKNGEKRQGKASQGRVSKAKQEGCGEGKAWQGRGGQGKTREGFERRGKGGVIVPLPGPASSSLALHFLALPCLLFPCNGAATAAVGMELQSL